MSSKLILSALATVAAIAVIAAPQDPSFEFPAAKHVGFDTPKDDLTQTSVSQDRVSVSFRNAPVREVLDWLKDQGVNFVVGEDQVDRDAKINVNVLNQSMDQLMNALAASWNGHWEKRDKIWVFKKGRDFFSGDEAKLAPEGGLSKTFTHLQGDGPLVGTIDGPTIWTDGDHQMTKAQRDAFEKAMKNMDDPKAWEEFQKSWQQWSREYEKNFRDFEKNFKGQEFKFDQKQIEEIQKRAEEAAKAGQNFRFEGTPGNKGFIYDGKNMKPMNEKEMKEFQEKMKNFKVLTPDSKEMEQHMKELQNHMKDFKILTPDSKQFQKLNEKQMKEMQDHMKIFMPDSKEFQRLNEKQMKEMQDHMKHFKVLTPNGRLNGQNFYVAPRINGKLGGNGYTVTKGRKGTTFVHGPQVSTAVRTHNLKAIWDSLTPAQDQKLKRLGYINYSDLNSTQRAMLGVITDESWTISYKTDKANLTIKSDR
jgi:hypothetical protein